MNNNKPDGTSNKPGSAGGLSNFLNTFTTFILAAGAIGSVILVLLAGRHSNQQFLQVLFVVWVLFPFGALWLINRYSKRWSAIARTMIQSVIFLITVLCLTIYTYVVIKPPSSELAFPFVVVPLVSWIVILIVIGLAVLLSRKH